MLVFLIVSLSVPIFTAISLRLIIAKWYHPADPGQVDQVEVYYSKANRITGYLVLCFIPFATGLWLLVQQPGFLTTIIFLGIFLFGFVFFIRLSNRVRFDQSGIRGVWFALPVQKSWSEVQSVIPLRTSVGSGLRINFSAANGLIRHMSLSIAYEGYEASKKLLEERKLITKQ